MRLELRLRLNEHRWGLPAPRDEQEPIDFDEELEALERAVLPPYLRNEAVPRYLAQWPKDSPARSWVRLLRESEEW